MAARHLDLPDIKTGIQTGMLLGPCRAVFWAVLAVGIGCLLFFGFKDAGTYQGYEAGSLLRPERYEDTEWTALFGDRYGLKADDLNAQVASMRAANLPGAVAGGAIAVACAAAAYAVGAGMARTAGVVARAVQLMDGELLDYLVASCKRDRPAYSYRDDCAGGPPLELGEYTVLLAGQPWADGGISGTPVESEMVADIRGDLDDIWGKAYLRALGMKLDWNGHIIPLTARARAKTPTHPDEMPHPDTEAIQDHAPNETASTLPNATASRDTAAVPAEAPRDAVFCPQCGAELPAAARFCRRCGTSLERSARRTASPLDAQPQAHAPVPPATAPQHAASPTSPAAANDRMHPDAAASGSVRAHTPAVTAPRRRLRSRTVAIAAGIVAVIVLAACGGIALTRLARTAESTQDSPVTTSEGSGENEPATVTDGAATAPEGVNDETLADADAEGRRDALVAGSPEAGGADIAGVPDTFLKEVYVDTCPKDGLAPNMTYRLAADGSWISIGNVRDERDAAWYDQTISEIATHLGDAADAIGSARTDGEGTWHETTWDRFRAIWRGGSDPSLTILDTDPQAQGPGGQAAHGTGSSRPTPASTSDEIAAFADALGPYSDGSTGTYESIPDTPIKQVWTACMPQAPISGLTYALGMDGSYLMLAKDSSYPPATSPDDPFMTTLALIVDASLGGYNLPDRFFQDGSGTWYAQSDNGFTALYRYDAETGAATFILIEADGPDAG